MRPSTRQQPDYATCAAKMVLAAIEQGAFVEFWFGEGPSRFGIRDLLALHKQSHLNQSELDGGPVGLAFELLARLMKDHPNEALPACGGIHLYGKRGVDPRLLLAGTLSIAVDLAARAGEDIEVSLNDVDILTLPLSRIEIKFPHAGHLVIRSINGELEITSSFGLLRIVRTLDGSVTYFGELEKLSFYKMIEVQNIKISQNWPTLLSVRTGMSQHPRIISRALNNEELLSINRAVKLISMAAPDLSTEIRGADLILVPLEGGPGRRESLSLSDMPGCIYTTLPDPFDLADLICHEYLHLRLFLLEEILPLIQGADLNLPSPWRSELRPARNVLHGVLVFSRIASAFDKVFFLFEPSDRGKQRRLIWRTCIEAAGRALLASCQLGISAFGLTLLEQSLKHNTECLETLREQAPQLALAIQNSVAQHLEAAGRPDAQEPWYLAI